MARFRASTSQPYTSGSRRQGAIVSLDRAFPAPAHNGTYAHSMSRAQCRLCAPVALEVGTHRNVGVRLGTGSEFHERGYRLTDNPCNG